MKKKKKSNQTLGINFEQPQQVWPDAEMFPLNLIDFNRTVEKLIINDINNSEYYLIVTGFSSLSYLVTFFGSKANFNKLKRVRVIFGWSPEERIGKSVGNKIQLTKEIKEYGLRMNFSILENGGAIINLIELINNNRIEFKILEKNHLHGKIYVGDTHSIMGSANFSRNGLTRQLEANVRVGNSNNPWEKFQYDGFSSTANNYYEWGRYYNEEIINLLKQQLKITTWQEALARGIAELLERNWSNDFPELTEVISNAKLWPLQKLVIGQALSILQMQGCVLIATPTGSGKTKLISILQLVLFHWLAEAGRLHKSYSQTICPPLVMGHWENEKAKIRLPENNPISMGILSFKQLKNYEHIMKKLRHANILVIDEAHNYMNITAQRSRSIAENTADNIILSTATPINKKSKDLLRFVELLGPDNLSDSQQKTYRSLTKAPFLRKNDFVELKGFISEFIVRKTKQEINDLIVQNPDVYKDDEGKKCKYPFKNYEVYNTDETKSDKEIATKIDSLVEQLVGILNLKEIKKPEYEIDFTDADYVNNRISSAKFLIKYSIRSRLRSSKVALIEHIEGTEVAKKQFGFKSSKKPSGNVLKKLNELILKNKLPQKEYPETYFPEWLNDLELYHQKCREEIDVYKQILTLTNQLSEKRENGKIRELIKLFKQHNLVIAFDNIVITLDYFKKLIDESPEFKFVESHIVTGTTDKKVVLEKFKRDSVEKNILALCSDSVSEGVNLQGASVIFLLDIPSVLRSAEQRIGRIDRLDSKHDKVDIFFPNDSDEFSLKTDMKLLKTLEESKYLIGNNITFPDTLLDRYQEQIIKSKKFIELLKEREEQVNDVSWEGLNDAYKVVRDLYQGDNAIITQTVYDTLKDVDVEVKVKISIGHSNNNWLFIALKGTKTYPPKWFFIEGKDVISDLSKICDRIRDRLPRIERWEESWIKEADQALKPYLKILQENEIETLPNKRKRAIKVAQAILTKALDDRTNSRQRSQLIESVLRLFETNVSHQDNHINFYLFSQEWLDILNDELFKRRKSSKKRKFIMTLDDLKNEHKAIADAISDSKLQDILDNAPYTESVWQNIASCILVMPFKPINK